MKKYMAIICVLACFIIGCAAFTKTDGTGAPKKTESSLCAAYEGRFPIGVATNGLLPGAYNPKELDLIRTHFNILTPSNCMKMYSIESRQGEINFRRADAFVSFAADNGMEVCGHCLIWAKDTRTPEWFFKDKGEQLGRAQLLKRIKNYIEKVAGRYRGKIQMWDVVNEALADDKNFLRPSQYVEIIGEDFIAKAFEFAHAAAPDALLIYNDYGLYKFQKREKLRRLLTMLDEQGAPIDAVGIQGHFQLDKVPYDDLEKTIELVKSFGLEVMVAELDIDVVPRNKWWAEKGKYREELAKTNPYPDSCPPELLERQAQQYGKLFALFSKHADSIGRITFWNVHDGRSWLNSFPWKRTNYPLLFDRELGLKPAFDAVISASAGD